MQQTASTATKRTPELPGVDREQFRPWKSTKVYSEALKPFMPGWTPEGWKWAYPAENPTLRSMDFPYKKGINFTTIIDGFLLSPNVKAVNIVENDLSFQFSDHQPVVIDVKLMK